jgi:hypothetical protein
MDRLSYPLNGHLDIRAIKNPFMMRMRKIIHVILLFYISQTQALAKSIANVNSYRQTNHN